MSGFANKNILILGGSRGIGAAIVRRFAEDGAKVALHLCRIEGRRRRACR